MTDRFSKLLSALGLLLGTAVALIYYQRGLTLSHYDAKAHLVVARRVLDSLTPEYSQIGAVWLPLPHLLNMLPVQVDAWYRTGASGVAISTKQNPRDWPLIRSSMSCTEVTSPTLAKCCWMRSSVA